MEEKQITTNTKAVEKICEYIFGKYSLVLSEEDMESLSDIIEEVEIEISNVSTEHVSKEIRDELKWFVDNIMVYHE